jgi:hypothetical protein
MILLFKYTEGIGSDGNTLFESCPWHQPVWWIFIGFSLSLQAKVAVVLQAGCDHSFHVHSSSLCTSQSLCDDGF